jgi:hypothetical protein
MTRFILLLAVGTHPPSSAVQRPLIHPWMISCGRTETFVNMQPDPFRLFALPEEIRST